MVAPNEKSLPAFHRYWIYQKERFPVFQTGMLVAAFTFSAASYSRICRGEEGFIGWGLFLTGAFTSLSLFLLLRLFDEFKDAKEDARYRPYRAVPRGLVSLKEVGCAIGVVVALILTLNGVLMPRMLWAVVAVLGYQLLMWREFFIPDWLRCHPVAYLITHMLIMPLIDFYTTGLDWLAGGVAMPGGLFFFLIVTFLNGCVIEIGRKIRAPHDEEAGVETYSALWGPKRAAVVWAAILTATGALAFYCCSFAGYGFAALPALLLAWLGCMVAAFRFLRTYRGGRAIENAAGIWTIAMYLIIGGAPMAISGIKALWN